jgi:type II secretory pathway pseudopilin PulG
MLSGRRVNFVSIRVAAQWLAGAAENDLHQGRLDAALQNLEALAGLARMERDEPTLVAQMIRVAVAGLGLAATWDALQAPGWTEAQLERLQKAWEPVDLVAALEWGFVAARAGGHELFAQLRRSRGPQLSELLRLFTSGGPSSPPLAFAEVWLGHVYLPAYKLTSIDEDELFYLKNVQKCLGALRLLKAHRSWLEAKQELLQAAAARSKVSGLSHRFRYLVSSAAIPNYVMAGGTAVNAETERQMTLAAIALQRYQLRHGKLPPSLEALVPEFLTAVPYDYMSAKPLCYRLRDDGSYVLYSVGLDGKDDGGDPTPPPGGAPSLWGGRDAVWPSPAAEPGEPAPQPPR